jgi:hypothetical protein
MCKVTANRLSITRKIPIAVALQVSLCLSDCHCSDGKASKSAESLSKTYGCGLSYPGESREIYRS